MKMTRDEWVRELRRLADVYERHPELPQPQSQLNIYCLTAAEFKASVKALGTGEKVLNDNYAEFKSGWLTVFTSRSEVCERKVIGRKEVAETTVPAVPAFVVPAHTEDVVEWDCPKWLQNPQSQ